MKTGLHFCSNSIIIEDEYKLYKFRYKAFDQIPYPNISHTSLAFHSINHFEILLNCPPCPFVKVDELNIVHISLPYSNLNLFYDVLLDICTKDKEIKVDYEYQEEVKKYIRSQDLYMKALFDKSRIKSLTEKNAIDDEIHCSILEPLYLVDGLFYLTDKRVYFQPIHNVFVKPVVSFSHSKIKKIYQRRYRLQHV